MKSPSLPVSNTLRVYDDILQAIGHTPLIRLRKMGGHLACRLYAKVEYFNPGGSIKDRIAANIINEAESSGRLKPGGTVVEATSGNTGVGLALVCAQRGYKSVFVLPDKMSQEKIQLLRAYGARVIVTPTAVEPEDPRSYYSVAKRIVAETPNAILANQYHNPENPRSHYQTTGPEIWEQTQGQVTDVVMGMGTGGTISGTGRFLKEKNPNIRIVGVDPVGSLLLETWQLGRVPDDSEASKASYKVEGIGEDFLPSTLDLSVIDDVLRVSDKEAFYWARRMARQEAIFCGGSSGAAVGAALRYAKKLGPDRLVVVILPDSGSRYLSKIFDDKWMGENGFLEPEWTETPLSQILAKKAFHNLITVSIDDPMMQVLGLFKKFDISQAPVVQSDGTLAGMVTEADLLKHLFEENLPAQQDTMASILHAPEAIYPASVPLETILEPVLDGDVVLVADSNRPVGILTRIDILDFIAQGG